VKRNAAAVYLGGAALSVYTTAYIYTENKPLAIVTIASSVFGAASGTHAALEASGASQEAAALQGAVTLHELQVSPNSAETIPHQ